jgi:serine/threonine-protein kinase RsbW
MGEQLGLSRPAALRLKVPCELAQVRSAVQAARAFLADQGCSETDLLDCELALVEASTNAIKFACTGRLQNIILIEILCDASEIEMRVTDSGPGFEWPDHSTLPEPENESGRGLFLIRSLMNYANYYRSASGNILLMRRQRSR